MNKKSVMYPIVFMLILSAVLVFILAFINKITTPIVEFNSEIELKDKILYVFNIPVDSTNPEEIDKVFSENIEEKDYEDTKYFVYNKDGEVQGYAVPFVGPGLWGTITGYLGVNKDFTETTGIEFVSQSETPGLGGRISESPYKEQYRGIDISNPQGDKYVINKPAQGGNVDAIAGATQTSTFVTDMVNKNLKEFIQKEGGSN
ncbi:FMN-binding protein [Lagierella sp.]|uniref:FMN-binding protein n=1 Tax=Lagierella sp. TaxID=2849657 RepID=UPI0026223B2B|nr:FMN-binding protein [Lagierella sp.]